jgi:signal transduction histidine kinase
MTGDATVAINSDGKQQERQSMGSPWRLIGPVALLVVFTVSLAVGAVWLAVAEIDRVAAKSTTRLALAAVEDSARNVQFGAKDYGYWDELAANVVEALNPTWTENYLGPYMAETFELSAIVVVGANGDIVYRWSQDADEDWDLESVAQVVDQLADGIAAARATPLEAPQGFSRYLRTDIGLSVAGIAPITPEFPEESAPAQRPRPVLIFLRALDEAWLARTAERFGFDNMRILADGAPASDHALVLQGGDGRVVAAIDWDVPGSERLVMRSLAVPAAVLVILCIVAAWVVVARSLQAQQAIVDRARDLTTANADLMLRDQQVRAALQRAEYATRAKSSFLARISHEIRTPLTAIIGFSQILKLQHRPNQQKTREQEYAEIIHESSQHLLALVNDLLDLSKIEAGTFEMNESWVDLNREITAVRTVLAVEAERKGVALRLDVPEDIPALYADPKTIRQILTNLVSNSLKFTPKGGRATIRLRAPADGSLMLTLVDTGAGIAEEDQEAIWQPFTRARNPALAQAEGTGLGLYLVKMLAEMHGADVHLESELGQGTSISINFGADRVRAVAA